MILWKENKPLFKKYLGKKTHVIEAKSPYIDSSSMFHYNKSQMVNANN
jgi:hypothetical protein